MSVHAYNARSERRSILVTGVRGNPLLLGASVVAVTAHVAMSHWGPAQDVLWIEPVTAAGWVRVLIVAAVVVLVSELHKRTRSRTSADRGSLT